MKNNLEGSRGEPESPAPTVSWRVRWAYTDETGRVFTFVRLEFAPTRDKAVNQCLAKVRPDYPRAYVYGADQYI